MTRFLPILGLAVIPLLSPMTGQAQVSAQSADCTLPFSLGAPHRSQLDIDNLNVGQDSERTYVDGAITSNARKAAKQVWILVGWFDENDQIVDDRLINVSALEPGETLPFSTSTSRTPEIVRSQVTIDRVL
jgi:hypothetical protein